MANADERGCPLANAAVELPEKDHPARRVIEDFKTAQRAKLIELCRAGGLREPDMLADELISPAGRRAGQRPERRPRMTLDRVSCAWAKP